MKQHSRFGKRVVTCSIVMELADHGDLYQKVVRYRKKQKYIKEDDIWLIFIQIVLGLQALHDAQILH